MKCVYFVARRSVYTVCSTVSAYSQPLWHSVVLNLCDAVLFEALDSNGDGFVDVDDLESVWKVLVRVLRVARSVAGDDWLIRV